MSRQRVREALRRSLPPTCASVALWLLVRPHPAILLAVLAAVFFVVSLIAPSVALGMDRLLRRIGAAVASVLARALAVLAWTLTVLPTWVLRRDRPGPVDGVSAWVRVPPQGGRGVNGSSFDTGRLGSRGHHAAGSSGPVRTVLLALAATALATVGLVQVGRAVDRGDDRPDGSTELADPSAPREFQGLPVDDYAHGNEPWAPEMFGELQDLPAVTDFFLGLRLRDAAGRYVNVRDGRRVSYTPADPELDVWFFGGSTMFGVGQRDDHTLPSVVARLAERDGMQLRAFNFGASSYASWQFLEQFSQALTSDELDPPDLAVFYGGVDDWALGAERAELGDVRPDTVSRLAVASAEQDRVRGAFDNMGQVAEEPLRSTAVAELTAAQYRRSVDLIDTLAASYGVPVVHVWQPSPFAKAPKPSDAELWRRLEFDAGLLDTSASLYREILRRSEVRAVDLTRVLDDVDEPVFFDGMHTNELGARIIGRAIYDQIRPQLAEQR